jgi:hypothetical protein
MTTTAIAVQELGLLPAEPLTQVTALHTAFERLRISKVNLVTPVSSMDSIPPMCGVSFRAVMVDSTVNAKGIGSEVYKGGFCSADERALGKVALEKIMAAAGVQILGKLRLDDRSDPYYCEMEFTLGVRDLDGTWRQATKSKAVDLRDGSAGCQKLITNPAVLREARTHILSNAETKAELRALRTLLHLKQTYTVEELRNPFVVPKLIPNLDPRDPDQKAALIDMALGRERQLYGHRPEPVRALPESAPPPVQPSEAAARPPAPPPPVGAPTAVDEDDVDDFPMPIPAAPPVPEAPAIVVCSCPCSCQAALTDDVARKTTERIGVPRCSDCYPAGRVFNVDKHRDLPGTLPLDIPKFPTMTIAEIREAVRQHERENAAKRAEGRS